MILYGKVVEPGKIGLYAKGHADYDELGKDIVCAAVSAITITAANGAHRFCKKVRVDTVDSGMLSFVCARDELSQAIIETALDGLDGIKAEHMDCFYPRMDRHNDKYGNATTMEYVLQFLQHEGEVVAG